MDNADGVFLCYETLERDSQLKRITELGEILLSIPNRSAEQDADLMFIYKVLVFLTDPEICFESWGNKYLKKKQQELL